MRRDPCRIAVGGDPGARRKQHIVGVASFIDGDTTEAHLERIRLFGIAPPESRQECRRTDGPAGDAGNKQRSLFRIIWVGDRSHVSSAISIGMDALFANAPLVVKNQRVARGNGWAVAHVRYSREYLKEELDARSARRGIWSEDFVMPWAWRRGERLD